jgi:hypothetical protein
MNDKEALLEAARILRERSEQMGYGYARPDDPHDFHPDVDSCTAAEIANHKAACDAWDNGTYVAPSGSESAYDADGKLVLHITRAPWGIGSYTFRDPQMLEAAEICQHLADEMPSFEAP